MEFANFDVETFLRDYWQKKPLLIRNPWKSWRNPLAPDELAGLACEDEIESRLITQTRDNRKVEHGPLAASRFGKLGKKQWTLLVQAVDHHVPEVAALLEPFRFIPNWRIDDIMVSYAIDGGGVGPHFDQYDVFLIQGLGRRRWRVGGLCDANTKLTPHDDLRLLAAFEPTDEWTLEEGDILYVPPRFAHDGIAVGDDCMTYSIGFRAPARSELIAHWCDHLLDDLSDDDRYTDPDLVTQANPGEISAQAIAQLHAMITEKMLDSDSFARWFGKHSSMLKNPDLDWAPETPVEAEHLRSKLIAGARLHRNPASRFSFIRQNPGVILLFVDGECFECVGETLALAESFGKQESIGIDAELTKSDEAIALITTLLNQGSLAFDPED